MAARERFAAHRKARGFTQETLAQGLSVTTSTVAHWEQGTSTPQARHRRPLAELLEVSLDGLDDLLEGGAREVAGVPVPGWLGHFASLEQGAAELWAFEPVAVPGLLQTEDYATAVALADHKRISAEEARRLVEVRMARQQALSRPAPLQLHAIVDESVLHRTTGDRATTADQLDHLADAAARPNITVQVMPLDGRVHCAAWGAFSLLTSPGAEAPYMACAEDLAGVRYHEAPHDVEAHAALFRHLSDVALDPTESVAAIRAAAKEIRS